jgi:hypothetical protein
MANNKKRSRTVKRSKSLFSPKVVLFAIFTAVGCIVPFLDSAASVVKTIYELFSSESPLLNADYDTTHPAVTKSEPYIPPIKIAVEDHTCRSFKYPVQLSISRHAIWKEVAQKRLTVDLDRLIGMTGFFTKTVNLTDQIADLEPGEYDIIVEIPGRPSEKIFLAYNRPFASAAINFGQMYAPEFNDSRLDSTDGKRLVIADRPSSGNPVELYFEKLFQMNSFEIDGGLVLDGNDLGNNNRQSLGVVVGGVSNNSLIIVPLFSLMHPEGLYGSVALKTGNNANGAKIPRMETIALSPENKLKPDGITVRYFMIRVECIAEDRYCVKAAISHTEIPHNANLDDPRYDSKQILVDGPLFNNSRFAVGFQLYNKVPAVITSLRVREIRSTSLSAQIVGK